MKKKITIKPNNKKPNLYKGEEPLKKESFIGFDPNCPFCKEDFIKEESHRILSIHKNNKILWVNNKYPISNELDTTLIIETNKCGLGMHNYELNYLKDLVDYIFEKKKEMENKELYDFIFVFRNYGKESSGSLPHSHTQINGLKKGSDIIINNKEESYKGHLVECSQNSSAQLLLSDEPVGEYFELNISWKEETIPLDAAFYLQKAIQYMDEYKDGLYTSYNLIFNEIDGVKYVKVVYRSDKIFLTPYLLAWDIHLYFENYKELIDNFRIFLKK